MINSAPHSEEAYHAHELLTSVFLRAGRYQQALLQDEAMLKAKPDDTDAKNLHSLFAVLSRYSDQSVTQRSSVAEDEVEACSTRNTEQQQFSNLCKREPKFLSAPDESQASCGLCGEQAITRCVARRPWQQAPSLVIANGLQVNSRLLGKTTDCERFHVRYTLSEHSLNPVPQYRVKHYFAGRRTHRRPELAIRLAGRLAAQLIIGLRFTFISCDNYHRKWRPRTSEKKYWEIQAGKDRAGRGRATEPQESGGRKPRCEPRGRIRR